MRKVPKPAPIAAIYLVIFFFALLSGSGLVSFLMTVLPTPEAHGKSPCDRNVTAIRSRFTAAWARAHAGERLDDIDLQALSDANDVLICLENRRR